MSADEQVQGRRQRTPAHEIKRRQQELAARRREQQELELLESAEPDQVLDDYELDDEELPVQEITVTGFVTTVDGKELKVSTDSDDPPVVLFGETPFFDFGSQLVQVERVQALRFELDSEE